MHDLVREASIVSLPFHSDYQEKGSDLGFFSVGALSAHFSNCNSGGKNHDRKIN
jgi:hypothetical protein